jgi:phage/plasmid-like protein (TIGR03299 family)
MEVVNQKPWHGIGMEVTANLSSREMLYKAKLDWEVSKIPSQRPKSYGNQETIRFFKGFFEAGEADIETVGGLDAGRILWSLARLNENFTLTGEDEVKGYVLLASRDEGREKIEVQFLTVRDKSHNMLKIASSAKPSVKNIFRRTFKPTFPFLNQKAQKFDDEMKKKANEMIMMGREAISSFAVDAQHLANKIVDTPMAWRYLFDVFQPETLKDIPTFEEKAWGVLAEKKTRLVVEYFFSQVAEQKTDSAGMTVWDLLNAVTYIVDHHLGPSQDSRLRQAWFGPNAKLKKRALDLALVL